MRGAAKENTVRCIAVAGFADEIVTVFPNTGVKQYRLKHLTCIYCMEVF